jgi:signal transduction histidine kinase
MSPVAVLYVDDEAKALQYFREAFEDEFPVFTASTAADGYAILMEQGARIGVLMSDQRMPGESGVELLEKARRLNPNLVRILVTAYTDYQSAVDAVNDGRIMRYVHKPWDPEELSSILRQAIEYHITLVERETLLGEKAESLRHMVMADRVAGLGILAEGLNHHMRNALTVIRAFVDLAPLKLQEELGGPPRDAGFWSEMHRQAQEQMARIQTVLGRLGEASSVTEVPRDQVVNVTSLLDEVTGLYRPSFERQGVQLSHYVHPEVPLMRVNGSRFSQLWRLIFADQLTHLHHGDRVHINVSATVDPKGQLAARFVISDTGQWDGEDDVANLFDPFFVRSHQPSEIGVNLTACYVIVHLHQGSIQAQLRQPRGLEIDITMPVDCSATYLTPESFESRLLEHERRWQSREA